MSHTNSCDLVRSSHGETRPLAALAMVALCHGALHHALWPLVPYADALSAPFHPFCAVRDVLTSFSSFSPKAATGGR